MPSAVVLEIGSSSLRAGLGGTDQPRVVRNWENKFPGPKSSPLIRNSAGGWEVDCEWLSVEIENSLFTGSATGGLGVDRYEQGVLFSISGGNKLVNDKMIVEDWTDESANRSKKRSARPSPRAAASSANHPVKCMLEILLESCQVPAICGAAPASLAAFATGRTTALVADFGASETSVSFVENGQVRVCQSYGFGGNWADDFLLKRLETDNFGVPIPEIGSEVKNSMCRVSPTPLAAPPDRMRSAKKAALQTTTPFRLADGTEIDVCKLNLYLCTRNFF